MSRAGVEEAGRDREEMLTVQNCDWGNMINSGDEVCNSINILKSIELYSLGELYGTWIMSQCHC